MTRKKSKFLTFCFSLLPGAGEMYMGFMKMGISLMALFFSIVAISSILNLGPFILLAAIVWFYGFFHVHNLAGLSDEDFYAVEDDYLFHIAENKESTKKLMKSYRKIIAVVLILLGVVLTWNSLYWMISGFIPEQIVWIFEEIGRGLPRLIIGFAILICGILMIRGKKIELDQDDPKEETPVIEQKEV